MRHVLDGVPPRVRRDDERNVLITGDGRLDELDAGVVLAVERRVRRLGLDGQNRGRTIIFRPFRERADMSAAVQHLPITRVEVIRLPARERRRRSVAFRPEHLEDRQRVRAILAVAEVPISQDLGGARVGRGPRARLGRREPN